MINKELFDRNLPGVWYFFPQDENAYKSNLPCMGFGAIKYGEGSVYTGEIYFDGVNYNKLGFGQQDFTYSSIGNVHNDTGCGLYKYVGNYDYRKGDWIYGNGVMYLYDADKKPFRFRTGFYCGLVRLGDYVGEFDYSTLLSGYTRDMEWFINERIYAFQKLSAKNRGAGCKKLLLGDSYFEFWESLGGENALSKSKNAGDYVNIGIGGTTFEQWKEYLPHIKDICTPEKIIINLGFNDIHSGTSLEDIIENEKFVVSALKNIYPSAEIYLLTAVHAPSQTAFYDMEDKLNNYNMTNAAQNGIKVIDITSLMDKKQALTDCFDGDRLHLNAEGYKVLLDITESC